MFDIPRIYSPPNFGELFFEHNPRGIGFSFHRAGTDVGQKDHLWMDTRQFCPYPIFFL
jgi:hypothetical protein